MNMFNDDPCPQWPRFMGRIDSLEDVKKLIDGYDCGVAYADQLTGQIFDKLKELVVDQLGVEEDEVTMEASMQDDLGADSLDLVDLVMSVEEEFGVKVADEDLENIKTVGDIVNYIEDRA